MIRLPFTFVAITLALAQAAVGQDQATTLLNAARAADVVVTAKVLAATDPSPEWHRLQLQTLQILKGQAPATFTLLEPSGACCGRSLFALQIGDTRLMFLRRAGQALHPFGGSRGVVAAEPSIVAHVQALLASQGQQELAHVLATCLAHDETRIADDAAHALATLPQLTLSHADRAAVVDALLLASARGSTRSAALVDVAVRVADDHVLDALLPAYLQTERGDQAKLLRAGLCRCPSSAVAQRLTLFVHDDRAALRAAELLVLLPTLDAHSALDRLLQPTTHPRVALCIAEGLLASGVPGEQLTSRVPAPVLALAERQRQQPKRFRAINPQRR